MKFNHTSVYKVHVNFEDVDAGQVVHHPKYIYYLERARVEAMRGTGYPFKKMLASGLAFSLAEMNVKYLRPALMDDDLSVLSRLAAVRGSTIKVYQVILNREPSLEELQLDGLDFFKMKDILFEAQLRLVSISLGEFRKAPLPIEIAQSLNILDESNFKDNPTKKDIRLFW